MREKGAPMKFRNILIVILCLIVIAILFMVVSKMLLTGVRSSAACVFLKCLQ